MPSRFFALLGIACLVALSGCVSAPVEAPYYARIMEFDDLEVPWVGCRLDQNSGSLLNPNCVPSDPVITRLDSRVIDSRNQLPLNNVRIWYTSPYNRIFLLPQEVLEAIEFPEPPSDGWASATVDQQELWAEFAGTYEDDYSPTYHEGYTDANGLSTVWLYIESMPTDEQGQALETSITVSIASQTLYAPLATSL